MPSRKGRQWTWAAWEGRLSRGWRGNYATASALAGMVFFALLSAAVVLREVAPTPPELNESPMLLAKRLAAEEIFQSVYLADCELAALSSIHEPFRSFAKKTGLYSPEAFPAALACLDVHLSAIGLATLETQLRSNKSTEILLDLSCVGDMRQTEFCSRAFIFARNKAHKVGATLADKIGARENDSH